MQNYISDKQNREDSYSIDKIKGIGKWCFGLVLNKALDNVNPKDKTEIKEYEKKDLFCKSLLRFQGIKKQQWYDGTIAQDIINNKDKAAELLTNLRNYFSHHCHTDDCLNFGKESTNKEIRRIMETAYERAKEDLAGRKTGEEVSGEAEKDKDGNIKKYRLEKIPWPELFDKRDKITKAGVVFFASLFTQRSQVNRLMSWISGLKKNEDEFGMTRRALSFYSLPDSYAEEAVDLAIDESGIRKTITEQARMFRDILGYLRRIPSETYKIYHKNEEKKKYSETEKDNEEKEDKETGPVERKTDKFAFFAMKYLEDSEKVQFARYRINQETRKNEIFFDEDELKKLIEEKDVPEQEKDKRYDDYKYYFVENNAILKTDKGNIRIGINELKYFTLLSLDGKGKEAIGKIKSFLAKYTLYNLANKSFVEKYKKELPPFILTEYEILTEDEKTKTEKRLKYLKEKWINKKKEYQNLRINNKVGGILRFINENLKKDRKLDAEEYNNLQKLLTMERFGEFEKELLKFEDERESRIKKDVMKDIKGIKSIDAMFLKVCEIVLKKLEALKGDELKEYIGLNRKPLINTRAAINQKFENVLERFIQNKISLPNGMLRELYLRENNLDTGEQKDRQKFNVSVENLLKTKYTGFDVDLDKKYYEYEIDKSKRDIEGSKIKRELREILAKDRLCLMMGMKYYKDIREEFKNENGVDIRWEKENNKRVIYADILDENKSNLLTLKFGEKDYAKMYVMDRPKFIRQVWKNFVKKSGVIEYHEFYKDGIEKGLGNFQTDVIKKVLMLEEKIIEKAAGKGLTPIQINDKLFFEIKKRSRQVKNDFEKHKEVFVQNDAILKAFITSDKDIDILKKIRNAAFHYQADFQPEEKNAFDEIMKNNDIVIEEKVINKQKKWKK